MPSEFMLDAALSPEAKRAYAQRSSLQYAAEISYADHHVGRLLDDLRARGVLDDALLLITSDHGENLFDHPPEVDHGYTVYQSTLHVLCVFRLPGGAAGGTRLDPVVSNIDLMPTVLRQLGLPAPSGMDGEPIDLENSSSLTSRTRFGQATKPANTGRPAERWRNASKARCVREGRYKLVQNPVSGREELYDVFADRGERTELLAARAPGSAEVAARLRAQLEAWAASADPLPSHFQGTRREETIRRLRSLGYVE
jgi:arylsulfatase A-like enzyme